jgi:hypothetical protein
LTVGLNERLRRAGMALVVVLALSACATEASNPVDGGAGFPETFVPLPDDEPPLDQQIIDLADPRRTPRPLDAYRYDNDTALIVSRARIIIGDRCMARFGFTPVPGWQPEGASDTLNYASYGLWDAEYAAAHGYETQPVPNPNQSLGPIRFTGDAISVYLGMVETYQGEPVPPGGCQGEEIATLNQVTPDGFDPAYGDDLVREASLRAEQDRRVVALMEQWRECMAAKGWDYPDVHAPFLYWSDKRGPDKARPVVSDQEKQAALDDVVCKKSTGLLGTWLAAEIAYQEAIVTREGERLNEFMVVLKEVAEYAKAIIAEG